MPIRDRKKPRYDALVKLPTSFNATVTVGIHGDGDHSNGMSIVQIGEIHEFGLGVPQRSWLRGWYDERKHLLSKAIAAELQAVITAKAGSLKGKPYLVALKRFAVAVQASIQKRIASNIPPPLSPVTIARKGSSVALIDTGLLRSSITAQVNDEPI